MAFKRGQELEDLRILEMKKEVIEKCRGVPLVLRTMGRLLQSRLLLQPHDVANECLLFRNNDLSKIIRGENDIIKTLKISYHHLPSQFKHCFAYCGLFPKDYEFEVQELINLSIAQGFIKSSSESEDLEYLGYEYLMHLVWGSFFEQPFKGLKGELRFKIHDLMHDLAISVAGTHVVMVEPKMKNFDENIRHVSFGLKSVSPPDYTPLLSLKENKSIRTFLSSKGKNWSYHQNDFDATWMCAVIFSNFKFLRALKLYNMGITALPNSCGELKHLRYLDLSNNSRIEMLPSSITRLHNLQTLNLRNCRWLKTLPQDIGKLVNLRHLVLDGCLRMTYMPHGLGKLTSLCTLDKFFLPQNNSVSTHIGGLCELSNLNSLRGSLEINLVHRKDIALQSSAANLREKHRLEKLCLLWNFEEDGSTRKIMENDRMSLEGLQPHKNLKELEISHYGGLRFANWFSSLTNIVQLRLHHCRNCQYLSALERLPSLKVLALFWFDTLEYISNEFSSLTMPFFPSLYSLSIGNCPNLKGWWSERNEALESTSTRQDAVEVQPNSFLYLTDLLILSCPKLTSMPFFPYVESLGLANFTLKPLQQTMVMATNDASSSTSSFSPLSKLKRLEIMNVEDAEFLPERIGNCLSLQKLTICQCVNLASLRERVDHLSSIQSLSVERRTCSRC